VFLVLFGLFGFFAAPPIVRSLAEKHGSEFLGRQLTLKEVAINPYTLHLTLNGLQILEQNGKDAALTLEGLAVDVEWSSVFRRAPVVSSVQIDQPWIKLVRIDEATYNFSDVLKKILDQPSTSDEPARFSINNIVLRGGRIDIDDQPLARQHAITGIEIGLPFVSNLPSDVALLVEPSISARINDAAFALTGQVRPFTDEREAVLKLELKAFDLARADEYSPVPLDFRIASGTIDTDIEVGFRQPQEGASRITLRGTLGMSALRLDDRAGAALLKLPALEVVLNEVEPLIGKADIASIRIRQPDIEIARARDGRLNLMSLLPAGKASPADAAVASRAAGPDPDVKIAAFEVLQARFGFNDAVPSRPFTFAVEPIDIVLRDFSLQGDAPATLSIDAQGDGGAKVKLDAKVVMPAMSAEGALSVAGVDVPRFAAYLPDTLDFSVDQAQARLHAKFKVALAKEGPQGDITVSEAGVAQLKLVRKGAKQPFAQAADIALSEGRVDLTGRTVKVDGFDIVNPVLRATREADGSIDLAGLVKEAQSPAAAPAGPVEPDGPPWAIRLGALRLKDGAIRLEDRTLAKSGVVEMDKLALTVEDVGTDKTLKSRIDLAFRQPGGGLFGARGGFSLQPMAASLKLDARRLNLLVGQPWMAERLNAELLRGNVSLRGDLGVQVAPAGTWALSWRGETTVADVHLTDKINASDLLKWRSLFIGAVALKLDSGKPDLLGALSVGEVALSDYFARIILSKDGRLNLQDIVKKTPPEPAPGAGAAVQPLASADRSTSAVQAVQSVPQDKPVDSMRPPIDVKRIVLQGGQVDFSDFFVKPNYRARLTELGGRVSGLSSSSGTAGDVELRGVVEGSAPIDIIGRVNPLTGPLFLDIKANARGIELAPLSPYSGKYVGYGIEKGKLSVSIAYKIENDQLSAQNNVVLDQLTFGAPVDSPDAIKAPILLAVSLLKDRNGVIDINLPISGSLSDPEFSIGGLVVKVVVNLIVKAVTSPFALLGSLFGSDADLDHVAFAPGRAALDETARGKLDTLGKALADRPALKIEVTGRTDPAIDVEGYRRALLDSKVKAVKAAKSKVAVDQVVLDPAEYPDLLEVVYKAASFPKPRNMIGLAKSLPVGEMETLILTHTEVSDEDLRLLGLARAQAVKEYLAQHAKIDDARLFVLAPNAAAKDEAQKAGDQASPARADFSIK
jgi:outer membrane protein OmpA-like peptidoglycan-associated protein